MTTGKDIPLDEVEGKQDAPDVNSKKPEDNDVKGHAHARYNTGAGSNDDENKQDDPTQARIHR